MKNLCGNPSKFFIAFHRLSIGNRSGLSLLQFDTVLCFDLMLFIQLQSGHYIYLMKGEHCSQLKVFQSCQRPLGCNGLVSYLCQNLSIFWRMTHKTFVLMCKKLILHFTSQIYAVVCVNLSHKMQIKYIESVVVHDKMWKSSNSMKTFARQCT